jgi:DNA-binding beta-propeller fold protein YncE
MDSRGARGLARSIALISTLLFLATAGDAAAATGSLAFVQQQSSAATMNGARGITVSPDGKTVYVAGQDSDTIVAYSRGAGGTLTQIGCYEDAGAPDSSPACAETEGLDSARFVAVSPNNANVYVTGGDDEAVVVFQRDTGSGALSSPSCISGLGSPATCPANTSYPLDGAEGIAVAPNGGQVYVAAQDDSAVVSLTRNPGNGALSTGPTCHTLGVVSGCTTTGGIDHPRELAVSPDGKGVYVASASSNVVKAFLRNTGSGALTAADPAGGGVGLPVGVAVSPDSKHVYAGAVNSAAVRTYGRDANTSLLTQAGCVKDTGAPLAGCLIAEGLAGVEGVAVSPDGLNVYGAGAGVDNAIVAMTRDPASGALGALECHRDSPGGLGCGSAAGLAGAHGVAVSPDGLNVYATGFTDDAVVAFQRQTAGAPPFDPPRPNPNCTNLVTLLVTCAEPNGPPGVCSSADSILPQCHFPTVLPQVCGPSNTLLVACVPPNNYVAACGGTGTVLPVCTLPPPRLPQVCGPSNTLLPACTGANNPIVVCGPPSRGLPACNLPPGAIEGSASLAGTGIVEVTVGCPTANTTGSPPTCIVDTVVVDRRRALISSLRSHLDRWAPFAIERTLSSAGLSGPQWNELIASDSAALKARANNVIDSAFRDADATPAPFRFTAALAALSSAGGSPPLRGSYPFEPFQRELSTFLSLLERELKEYQSLISYRRARGSSASGASVTAAAASRLVKPLARKRVKIRAGKRKRVKVTLSKRAVKQLRKGVAKRKAVAVRLLVTYKSKPRPVVSMVDFPIRVVKPKANSKGKGKAKRGKSKSKRR